VSNGETQTDVVGAGDKAVTQPAERALGYGDTAVAQGKAPAKPPAQQPKKAATFHDFAVDALKDLAIAESSLTSVQILPWDQLQNKIVKNGPWDAWTNSGTVIYLRKKPLVRPANAGWAYIIIYHETRHILDFNRLGTPKTYIDGLRSETKAQDETFNHLTTRLANPKALTPKALTPEQIQAFKADTTPGQAKSIQELKDVLSDADADADKTRAEWGVITHFIDVEYLPASLIDRPGKKILIHAPDLYKPSP
jgi:hypothetical protein